MKRDYYETLGVEKGADAAAIKSAYRKLARQFHPDVSTEDNAEEKFKEVSEAYDVLSNEQKRAAYDRYGHDGARMGAGGAGGEGFEGFGGFSDIFDMFFGGASGGQQGRRGGPQAGANLRYNLELTLEEALTGGEKTLQFPRIENCETCGGNGAAAGTKPDTCVQCGGMGQVRKTQQSFFGMVQQVVPCDRCSGRGQIIKDPCTVCSGKGRVRKTRDLNITIPPGVDSGMQLPVKGEGEGGVLGGPSGDLYVFFEIKEHPIFEREGLHLFREMPVSLVQATLGDEVLVKTLSGDEVSLSIPEGTQPGTAFVIKGQGMPDVRNSARRGDLHVAVNVTIPKNLKEEEKEVLRQFSQMRGEKATHEKPKGVFGRLKEALTGE
jgi:molecular chaperone DnaJ